MNRFGLIALFGAPLGVGLLLSSAQADAQGISTTGNLRSSTPQADNEPPAKTERQIARERREAEEAEERARIAAMPSIDEGARLDLMCYGDGAANKSSIATAFGFGSFGGYSALSSATVVGQRSQGFSDQVSLFIDEGEGRLRMPRTMLPAIRGGEDGWFKLHDIKIARNEITASVGVSMFNNPKLRLDRYSGSISISGKAGDFAGHCKRFDPETEKQEF